jgi:hypothetical protein
MLLPRLYLPGQQLAEKLSISSTPLGATAEIDVVNVGMTPFEKDYRGGYFHRWLYWLVGHWRNPIRCASIRGVWSG